MLLETEENTLLAFVPINRIVATTIVRITASMTAYSAMSCPSSPLHSLCRCDMKPASPCRAAAHWGRCQKQTPVRHRRSIHGLRPKLLNLKLGRFSHLASHHTPQNDPGDVISCIPAKPMCFGRNLDQGRWKFYFRVACRIQSAARAEGIESRRENTKAVGSSNRSCHAG